MHPLLITLGDPDGLGPELVCRLAASHPEALSGRVLLIGPGPALIHHVRRLGMDSFWREVGDEDPTGHLDGPHDGIWLYCPPEVRDFESAPGRGRPEGGLAAGASLEAACRLMRRGQASALVTCPLNKAMLNEAGFDFPGHTEFLATRLGVGPDNVCMHLCGPRLRVSLVTTHPRLADVPGLVTREKILRCLRLTAGFLDDIGAEPRTVAVCGLNPHAGESGKIGDEESLVIAPAIEAARAGGVDAEGPLPGDTVFRLAADGRYGAVLAMYHDQGLAPLKLLHFHEAVNVTLGLPVPRTSVDHGTGYDLVGRDTADISSLRLAVDLARRLAASRS